MKMTQAQTKTPFTIIVGDSGRGKTTSIRNLDPETTAIINVENKVLPFPRKVSEKFAKVLGSESPELLPARVKQMSADPKIKTIIVDSFTSWARDLEAYCKEVTASSRDGFEKWNKYYQIVKQLLDELKASPKYTFMFAIPEVFENKQTHVVKETIATKGSWKGQIEETATVIFWADVLEESGSIMDEGEKEDLRYVFKTKPEGNNCTKVPMGMFEEKYIDNDLRIVMDMYKNYFGELTKEDIKAHDKFMKGGKK